MLRQIRLVSFMLSLQISKGCGGKRESLIMMSWLGNGLLPCCTIIYDVGISFCTTVNLGLIANSDNKSNPKTTPNNIYTYKYLLRYCGYLTIPEIAREANYTENAK